MIVLYKIYKVVPVTYDTVSDGYYNKDLVRYELHSFDSWDDTFLTEQDCISQIENFAVQGTTYTIQKEYYIQQSWEK